MASTPEVHEKLRGKSWVSRYQAGAKISELYAEELVTRSGVAECRGERLVILDNACGTGAVSGILHRFCDEETRNTWELTCCDVSVDMVGFIKERMDSEGWNNSQAKVVDAQDTRLPGACYTHVFTAFAFNLFPDPKAALNECFRVLRKTGTLAISVWKEANWISVVNSAIATMPGNLPYPTNKEVNALHNEGWDSEGNIRALLEQAGFGNVRVTTIAKQYPLPLMEFVDACMILIPYLLVKYWTPEQRQLYEADVPRVLKEHLEKAYGTNGMVPMEATAIIAVGQKL